MKKKYLSILIILLFASLSLYAAASNSIGIRFDYSLQQVDVKREGTDTKKGYSDYGYGSGIFFNHTFNNNIVVGAETCFNFYSYKDYGFTTDKYFTFDVMLKGGYRFATGNFGYSILSVSAGLDYRHYDEMKGHFPVIGADLAIYFPRLDTISLGLGTQVQMVFQNVPNDSYGKENILAFRFYIAASSLI